MSNPQTFNQISEVASHLRQKLNDKKFILLFAYNGTGKTRLSMEYKQEGKKGENKDTLYFNAFTEDLFYWDNDIQNDEKRSLKINTESKFFDVLENKSIDLENNYIGPSLQRYADFSFKINYDDGSITFERDIIEEGVSKKIENIKISRGEESIFIWCFFLAVAQLAVDKHESYKWVKFIYVDDPISSLDDNNAIAVACHLADILNSDKNETKAIISTHHSLFFNVMWNELRPDRKDSDAHPYFLEKNEESNIYKLRWTGETPFFHHIALLKKLKELSETGKLYTYHFNILRNILERTASYHGYKKFSDCIKKDGEDDALHARMINVLSHGNYSLFEPREMVDDTKALFNRILENFLSNYRFNPELFDTPKKTGTT